MASKTAPLVDGKLKRISAGIRPDTWTKAKKLAKASGVSLMRYVSDAVEQRVGAIERKRGAKV